jgi:uncharacterized protein (DUF58 family)
LRESTELKPLRRTSFRLCPTGFLILALLAAAFSLGRLRGEPVLTLIGAVFLSAWTWCFLAAFCLFLSSRGRAAGFSLAVSPREIPAGAGVELVFPAPVSGKRRFFRLPGALVRCGIRLKTRDGRVAERVFDPDLPDPAALSFRIPLRGAYYSDYDAIAIRDVLGFFQFSIPLPQDTNPRLLVSPGTVEPLPIRIPSGGREDRAEIHYRRTDDPGDHRPYVPGDDPRRIDWKLYSHGGDLFVRQGEPEHLPQSRLLILVDTETDPALYDPGAGREGVDRLCEKALATALECSARGIDVLAGYPGGGVRRGSAAEMASLMALPASIPLFAEGADYPKSGGACLVLALPRTGGGDRSSALDRFLRKREAKGRIDILFLYQGEKPAKAAEICAALYSRKEGVHARRIRL